MVGAGQADDDDDRAVLDHSADVGDAGVPRSASATASRVASARRAGLNGLPTGVTGSASSTVTAWRRGLLGHAVGGPGTQLLGVAGRRGEGDERDGHLAGVHVGAHRLRG